MATKTILVLGDLHSPFVNTKALKWAVDIARDRKPDLIVQIGDAFDMFSFSAFPRSLDYVKPKDEIEHGRVILECLWHDLQKASPKARCYQLTGNHDARVLKRVISTLPALECLIDLGSLFSFKGVKTLKSERDELFIDDLCFMHGFRSKLGDHSRHNGMKTIVGHSHQGGVVYQRLGDKIIWELNAGYLADPNSEALSYTRQRRISNWTTGVGLIDELGPRFIPYET